MSVVDIWQVKQEWVNFLRNSNIFTLAQRSVVTTTENGTLTAETEILIDVPNVKNIRSVVVDSVSLRYGFDYTVDFNFLDGTQKCKITLRAPATGNYVVTYDYGSDKIFPDFPREDLALSSFPRIGADVISMPSEIIDMDGGLLTTINITTVVYADNLHQLGDYITAIASALNTNKKNFYYIGKFVRKTAIGPILKIPEEISLDKIFQQNIDVAGILNFER